MVEPVNEALAAPLLAFDATTDLSSPATRAAALETLEGGGVLVFPRTGFEPTARECELMLDRGAILPGQKERDSRVGRPTSILYPEDGRIQRTNMRPETRREIEAMMMRYSAWAQDLVATLLPSYRDALQLDRVTYRPCERTIVQGLHVDSSYGRPSEGRGMLRLFCNVNPGDRQRTWQVGERFEPFVTRFLPNARVSRSAVDLLRRRLGLIRGTRTRYDRLIANIRRLAKDDEEYQRCGPRRIVSFPRGASWMAITDLVVHAAISGQHSLDQTFFLRDTGMRHPSRSSLRILERLTGRALT